MDITNLHNNFATTFGNNNNDNKDNNNDKFNNKDLNNNMDNNLNNRDMNKNNDNIDNDLDDCESDFNNWDDLMPKKKIKLGHPNDIVPTNLNLKLKFKCLNCKCDHKKHIDRWTENNPICLTKINNLSDLILLSTYYHCKMRRFYNGIDLKILFGIKEHLEELDKMIGLTSIKEEIVNLVIHLMLISNSPSKTNTDMLHSVVTGSPGCGKTTFIEILSKILTKLGVLKSGHIVKVKRSDLIGKYLGHTAVQTQKKIDEAKGGILLIDEAYSLGNPEQRDSFSKECLDTLNQALSENKNDFICIIAGYANALDSSFFSYNEGLRRRFPFRFDILPYTPEELGMILNKKLFEYKYWTIKFTLKELLKLINDNFKYFINQGGDMETLFLNIKIVHNKRIFLIPVEEKKDLLIGDIKESIDKFIKLKGSAYDKNKLPEHLSHLYC